MLSMIFPLLLSAVGIASAAPNTPGDTNLRILPLGDSITLGVRSTNTNGYRENLELLLQQRVNYGVHYVGNVVVGKMYNNNSEGLSGRTIAGVHNEGLGPLRATGARPNVVLLLAGANDVFTRPYVADVDYMIGNLSSLVDDIHGLYPQSAVVLSKLIPSTNATYQKVIDAFNARIPAFTQDKASKGYKILSISPNLTTADIAYMDDRHPSDTGYRKLAANWFDGILSAHGDGIIVPPEGSYTANPRISTASP